MIAGRLGRDPQRRQAELAPDLDQEPADRRMQMHVLVRVGVVEPQPGGREGLVLRPDLGRQPAAHAGAEEIVDAESQLVGPNGPAQDDGPSITTRCSPTPRPGSTRARRTASAAAGPATIRLAVERMPCRWAISTASLTSADRPKSSAETMTRRASRLSSGRARA